MAMVGLLAYQADRVQILESRARELTSVGTLKAAEIAAWRRERLADVIRFTRGPTLIRAIERENPADVRLMLSVNRKGGIYDDVLLVASSGKILGSALAPPPHLPAETTRAVTQAFASRQPVLSDFYMDEAGSAHIDAVATVSGATQAECVLVLRCNASERLYPLIKAWPGSSTSAESVLVRRDGDQVAYLSCLRHQSHKAMSLKRPLSEAHLPAVQAILGRQGVFSGSDYRGVRVLADLRPIPESDWFVVTKVDAAELLGSVRERALAIAGMVLLGILLAAVTTALGFRHRQASLYRSLYNAQREQFMANAQYRTILYSIGDAVITSDSTGCVVQMNPAAEALTGWNEADAKGLPLDKVFRIINETTREAVSSLAQKVLREGRVTDLANHTLLLARDGKEYPIADSAAPVFDDQHAVVGVVLVFKDQTVERAAQRALADSERHLKALIAHVPGVVFRCGMDSYWTMQYLSANCRELTGYDPETLIDNGKLSYYDLIHPDDRQKVWDTINAQIKRGAPYTIEYRIITADGTVKWVWESGSAAGDDAEGTNSLEGVIHDITARRMAAEQEAELTAQIQQTQRLEALGRMAGGVAHDFNNALTVIIGNAEWLQDSAEMDEDRQKAIQAILQAGHHAAGLVNRLLGFAARQTSLPRAIQLDETVSGLLEPLEHILGPRIRLTLQSGASPWPVMMDPDQMTQILVYLAENAHDAITDEGAVTVAIENMHIDGPVGDTAGGAPPGDHVCLSFRDTGCGMDDETQAQIFDPFFSTKSSAPDTGMGLAIIYGIVKQNRGFIRLASQPDSGTCFFIYLPRHGQPAPTVPGSNGEPTAPAMPPVQQEHATILLAEDEPALLNLTERLLTGMGYSVLAAQHPNEALRMARDFKGDIALLLTDVIMPTMNGAVLCETLLRERPTLRRLFMSGYTADVIAQQGVLPANTPFLQKPFTRDQLSAKVREALGKQDA
jgi:PAS domain S-box-containing protein